MKLVLRLCFALLCTLCPRLNAGNLKVNLAPSQAVGAGAQWRVDGGTWRSSGTTASGLSNAGHTVDFNAVSGWVSPAAIPVTVVNGTTTLTGTYVQTAALKITLTPSSGQWRIDGGTWRASGATVTGLTPGNHGIDYASVSGYASPSAESVTLTAGQTTTLSRSYVQLAKIKLTLSPASGQWQVDGGAWQTSGATLANLAVGSHTIAYSVVSGYAAPAAESVTLASGQLLTLNRSYVQLAQLTVTLAPSSAQWRVDGGAWRASGATVANLAVGAHTVDYAALGGYSSPASESVSLASGQSLSLNRSYVQLAQLTVTLSPASAQWRVDGGAWKSSGAAVSNLTVGAHTFDYAALNGYTAPASESVSLASGQSLSLNRSYVQLAQVSIFLTPTNAQWRIDGGAWQASGATVSNLAPGNHAVEYTSWIDYISPAPETVTLAAGQSLSLSRSYTARASIRITLVPDTGQWRIPGGAWNASDATVWVDPGTYALEFAPVEFYDPPAFAPITLASGGSFGGPVEYQSTKPTLQIQLVPNAGQWRVDGGAWQPSGAVVKFLDEGSHAIDYLDLGGDYNPLASETLSLSLRQHAALLKEYPVKPATATVTLTPGIATWRIFPGTTPFGAWQNSGASAAGLAPGSYTIEYAPVSNYTTPASEVVTLSPAQLLTITRDYTPLASLNVVLTPSFAQWRLDAGSWQSSSTTLNDLSLGSHTLEYSAAFGYVTPAPETVTLVGGANSITRSYTQLASFNVSLNPSGAQWRLDGGQWQFTSATLNNLSLGAHTVDFASFSGYIAPSSETVTLVGGANSITRSYTQLASFNVSLNLSGAQWRLDGGQWQFTSATLNNLSLGAHTVDFASFSGYIAPPSETVTLVSGANSITRSYTQLASFNVSLNLSGAQWRLDGGQWQFISATLNNLSLGNHLVEFNDVSGYIAPAPVTVTLVSGTNPTLTRSYTQLASFNVSLNLSGAQWRLDGGQWQFTSATLNNLSLGNHLVEFNDVSGYIAPAPVTVTLVSGTNPTLTRSYTQLASFNVSLNLSGAQWRLDGGQWQFTSGTLNNLSLGDHLVEFNDVSGYIAPAPVTVTLVSGTNPTLTRSYTQLASFNVSLNLSGAQWRLDGGQWQFTSATLNNLSLGNHLVEFNDVSGYIAPAPVTVTLVSGSNSLARAYTPLPAGMTVTLTPAEAQWRVDGGAWLASGATANGLAPGDHIVEYSDVAGYSTPAPHTVTLSAGVTTSFLYAYAPAIPSFATITTLPDAGNGATFIRGSEGVYYIATVAGGGNGGGEIFRINLDGSGYAPIKAFRPGTNVSTGPVALTEGSDHVLYGTTTSGGVVTNAGTVFRINKDGTGFAILYSFASADYGSSLIEGSDGSLYGTTNLGGISNTGLIFRMNKDGTGYATISAAYGARGLVEGPGGLYATTPNSNLNGLPCIFRCGFAGGITMLHQFTGGVSDGSSPKAVLLRASDGTFYGTTQTGGTANKGVVYRMNFDGTGFAVLRSFLGGTDGSRLDAALSEGPDGMLYGATYSGGTSNRGTVFRMNKDGSGYAILRSLLGNVTDGGLPNQRMVIDPDGVLVGATSFSGGDAFGTLFKMNSDGTAFAPLLQFGAPLGANPNFVIEGSDGALYGGTYNGGGGRGALFKVNKDGTGYTFLHGFTSASGGEIPLGRLIEGDDGLLYGTTLSGIPSSTVFRMNKDGTGFTSVHDFSASTDGSLPYGGITQCSDGLLYGTTAAGGTLGGYGTVYRLNKDGTGYATLRSFANGSAEGNTPTGALIEGPGGKLYGAHWSGGTANAGTLFSMAKDGTGYTVLHPFAGGTTDGSAPYGTLFLASDGRLYGTTSTGGTGAKGTVFGLNADGTGYAILKNFAGGSSDGASPQSGSLVEKEGALFGTTTNGGLFDNGTLYKINKDGTGFTILVNFGVSPDDGRLPTSGVIKASDGRFYGTTYSGTNGGTVFFLQIN